jgi:putative addiction module component (TIGR02574 family)
MPAGTDLKQMSTSEKLRLMEALWQELSENGEVPVPEWHKQLLGKRERKIRAGKASFRAWEAAKKQIQKRVHAD